MVRVGIVVFLLGIPGLLILPLGIGLIICGALLMVVGTLGNTAKAGVGVASFAAKSVAHQATTKTCPECRSDMPRAAVVCLSCGYREPAASPTGTDTSTTSATAPTVEASRPV